MFKAEIDKLLKPGQGNTLILDSSLELPLAFLESNKLIEISDGLYHCHLVSLAASARWPCWTAKAR